MNYCGIILAKKDSKRLPNKNFLDLGDKIIDIDVTSIKDKIPIICGVTSPGKVFEHAKKAIELNKIDTYLCTNNECYTYEFNAITRPPRS